MARLLLLLMSRAGTTIHCFSYFDQRLGNTHGVEVNESQTVLSGRHPIAIMALDDNGVTFRNDVTGGAVTVTGVWDKANTTMMRLISGN